MNAMAAVLFGCELVLAIFAIARWRAGAPKAVDGWQLLSADAGGWGLLATCYVGAGVVAGFRTDASRSLGAYMGRFVVLGIA